MWNSHVGLWPRAHTEKSAAVPAKSGSSLTCCGTCYKLLHSSQESKHRQQCPRIELRELGRARLELKLSLCLSFQKLVGDGLDLRCPGWGGCSLLPMERGKYKQESRTRREWTVEGRMNEMENWRGDLGSGEEDVWMTLTLLWIPYEHKDSITCLTLLLRVRTFLSLLFLFAFVSTFLLVFPLSALSEGKKEKIFSYRTFYFLPLLLE